MTADVARAEVALHVEPRLLGPRLSFMMFLQYAIPGIWVPVLTRYLGAPVAEGGLGFTQSEFSLVVGIAGSVGAVTAPFIAGQIADRYFSTERVMAALLVASGVIKYVTAFQQTFWPWLILSIAYSILYTPTMMLSNSLAFSHMTDRDRQFPLVRLWGTIGWIVGGVAFAITWLQTDVGLTWKPPFLVGAEKPGAVHLFADALRAAGVVSVIYGLYALTLPHTPPKREAPEPLAFLKAFRLMKRPSFAVLILAGLLIAPIHQVYFMQTGPFLAHAGLRNADIQPAMSLGQFGEILMMAILGLMLKRLGFKWVMVIGAAAYFLRYVLFGAQGLPLGVIVASQALHGVCFACFLAAAYMYVDRLADPDIRHSAQQVFGLVAVGAGPVLGARLNAYLAAWFSPTGAELAYTPLAAPGVAYTPFWFAVAGIGLAATVMLALLFRSEARPEAAPKPG